MKNIRYKVFRISLILSMGLYWGCGEDFLERPPKDQIVDGSFYSTNEQVLAGTALLYNRVWFDYNDKASYNLGDFRGGTVYSAWNDRTNVEFNTTSTTGENGAAWRAFFNVVGQANTVIANVNRYAGAEVSDDIKKHAIAEAKFMRSLAYSFLVMNWGPVPIIENNQTLLSDTTKARNTTESVWRLITRDMVAAAKDLPVTPVQLGRVSKYSAEAMLSRFYLTRAGVGKTPNTRDQVFLDSAKYYAERVIQNSDFALLRNYADLFKFPYDNNSESVFSLQWVVTGPDDWGWQNSAPAYLAYSSSIGNGDGWGNDKSATYWMLSQYEGFIENGNTVDQRLKATFMLPGAHYPEVMQDVDGSLVGLVFPYASNEDFNFASIKKYVLGRQSGTYSQKYGHNTYMMRLSEVYLNYAEAVLGNNASTTDAKALEYFNAIRLRAGLPELEDPLTADHIFRERIVEFAMEARAWYDLVHLHYYNPDKAYEIISNQDRGLFKVIPNQFPNPTSWSLEKTSWDSNRSFTAYSGNFLIPLPAVELAQAPNLAKPPVDYDFGD